MTDEAAHMSLMYLFLYWDTPLFMLYQLPVQVYWHKRFGENDSCIVPPYKLPLFSLFEGSECFGQPFFHDVHIEKVVLLYTAEELNKAIEYM